jgi:hypothetical protein
MTRVGGNRLQALAQALDVSIPFFFEAAPGSRISSADTHDFINVFLADKRGLEVARHFVKIGDTAARDAILVITEVFAKISRKAD